MTLARLSRISLLWLLATAVLLPIAICVLLGASALLNALGDAAGGAVLGRIALAGGVLWVLDLICLVLLQTLARLIDSDRGEPE